MSADLLKLLGEFYDATVNDDSQCCFGCGVLDIARLRVRWADQPETLAELEREIVAHPRGYRTEHKPDCIIQRARAVLGRTS